MGNGRNFVKDQKGIGSSSVQYRSIFGSKLKFWQHKIRSLKRGFMLVLAYFSAGFGDGRGFQKHLKVPEKYLKTSTKPRFGPKKNDFPVKFINDSAFHQSAITSIDLPATITVFNALGIERRPCSCIIGLYSKKCTFFNFYLHI